MVHVGIFLRVQEQDPHHVYHLVQLWKVRLLVVTPGEFIRMKINFDIAKTLSRHVKQSSHLHSALTVLFFSFVVGPWVLRFLPSGFVPANFSHYIAWVSSKEPDQFLSSFSLQTSFNLQLCKHSCPWQKHKKNT